MHTRPHTSACLELDPGYPIGAPIDVTRSAHLIVPGIVAHESAMSDGNCPDVPVFD